jgi:hypothetical protein
MHKEYFVTQTFLDRIQPECNKMAGAGWELVTAYSSSTKDCCGNTKESAILIFGR